jgi:hypothetical protein
LKRRKDWKERMRESLPRTLTPTCHKVPKIRKKCVCVWERERRGERERERKREHNAMYQLVEGSSWLLLLSCLFAFLSLCLLFRFVLLSFCLSVTATILLVTNPPNEIKKSL